MSTTLEMRMVAAHQAGRDTATDKRPRVNPYDGSAATAVERVLAVMWARGYSAGNPVDLDAPLDLPPETRD